MLCRSFQWLLRYVSLDLMCLILRCPSSYSPIRSSFTAKTSSMETSVPAASWSPRTSRPSFGACMGFTQGRTREPLRKMIPAGRNGRHQSCWPRDRLVRAATCEFVCFHLWYCLNPSTQTLQKKKIMFCEYIIKSVD